MVLVEPENRKRENLPHSFQPCGPWFVRGWQEGQTDKRSRWHPGGCCRVSGYELVGAALFTIHMPSASAGSDCVPVTKREQRDGGRELSCHVRKPTDRLLIFTTFLHSVLAAQTALTDLAPLPVVNQCDIVPAAPAFTAAIHLVCTTLAQVQLFGFNLHKPTSVCPTSVLQRGVKWRDRSCLHRDLMSHSGNLIWQTNLWNS